MPGDVAQLVELLPTEQKPLGSISRNVKVIVAHAPNSSSKSRRSEAQLDYQLHSESMASVSSRTTCL